MLFSNNTSFKWKIVITKNHLFPLHFFSFKVAYLIRISFKFLWIIHKWMIHDRIGKTMPEEKKYVSLKSIKKTWIASLTLCWWQFFHKIIWNYMRHEKLLRMMLNIFQVEKNLIFKMSSSIRFSNLLKEWMSKA
jgi:hypothetical protein